MSKEEVKQNWYNLDYGDCCGDSCEPTVLYTSESGLRELINALQKVEATARGVRTELEIAEMDRDYSAPFTHIEILEKPLEEEESEWSWKPFIWVGLSILLILFLAGYGFFELVKSIL